MKKILNVLVIALCLTAGSAFSATEGRPVFQGWAQDPAAFKATLVELGAIKEGFVHVSDFDGKKGNGVASSLHVWMVKEKLVNEAGKNIQFFTDELVKMNGSKIPEEQFMLTSFAGKFIVPSSVLAAAEVASVAPAVQPSAATAVAPVAQFAPSVPPAERAKFEKMIADMDSRLQAQARAMATLQSQLDNRIKTKAELSDKDKQDLVALKSELTKAQQALKEEAGRFSGLAAASLASGGTINEATAKLQKQIDDIVADASAVLGRVSAGETQVKGLETEVKGIKALPIVQYGTQVLYAIAATILLLLGIGTITWRRITAVKLVARDASAKAEEAGTKAEQAFMVASAARNAGIKLAEQVDEVADAVGFKKKNFSFDDQVVQSDLRSTAVGGVHRLNFTVDNKDFVLIFSRVSETHVKVNGIPVQTEPVRIENVPARIKRAANKGDLVGVDESKVSVLRMAA